MWYVFYTKLLSEMRDTQPRFEPTIILSQPAPVGWPGLRGHVTDLIREQLSSEAAVRTEAYLCGGWPMMPDTPDEIGMKEGCPSYAG